MNPNRPIFLVPDRTPSQVMAAAGQPVACPLGDLERLWTMGGRTPMQDIRDAIDRMRDEYLPSGPGR